MAEATILHVEDDSNDAVLLQHACQRAGVACAIQVVSDGDDAIKYLSGASSFADRKHFPPPNLVLLDLKMPKVNGFELLGWIRGHPQYHHLPAVVLTSSDHETDVKRAYEAGANSYLVKPVDFNSLVELVKSLHHYWLKLNQPPERNAVG